jgi:hypothetical protein
MSKKTKTAAAERRKKDKRSRKDAQRAKYEAWSKAGSNKKKKQSRGAGAARTTKHEVLFCGNVGCKRCNKSATPLVSDMSVKTVLATFPQGKLRLTVV